MEKHLDWHYKNNRREKQKARKVISKLWFLTSEEWVKYDGILALQPKMTPFFGSTTVATDDKQEETPISTVVVDESQSSCNICGEAFTQIYDKESEEWLFKQAVKDPNTGFILHEKCYKDSISGISTPIQDSIRSSKINSTNSNSPTTIDNNLNTSISTGPVDINARKRELDIDDKEEDQISKRVKLEN